MAMIRVNHGNGTATEFQGDAAAVTRQAANEIRDGRNILNRKTGEYEHRLGVAEGGMLHLLDGYVFEDGTTLEEVTDGAVGSASGDGVSTSDDPSAEVEAQLANGTQAAADDADALTTVAAVVVEIVPGDGGSVNVVVENNTADEIVLWRDTGTVGEIKVKANSRLNRKFKNHGAAVTVRLGDADGVELAFLPGMTDDDDEPPLTEISADESE